MNRHEIEIEGLPEGVDPVSFLVGNAEGKEFVYGRLQVRRKVRKYDWSKTLDDVLVITSEDGMYRYRDKREKSLGLAGVWQPNIHGNCPVDGEASVVRVRRAYGAEYEALAKNIEWRFLENPILGWQFIRLADGYEW